MAKKKPALLSRLLAPVASTNPTNKKKKPTNPASPPLGTYDPALDAQVRASERGLRQLQEDAGTTRTRATEDLSDLTTRAGRNRDLTLGDLATGRGRTMEDYGIRETRGNRDFDSQLSNVFRQFGILGNQQNQTAAAQGVFGGGTGRASAAKRTENQDLARKPIDQGRSDLMADLALGRGRTEEDYTRDTGRVGQDYWDTVIAAQKAYMRGDTDLFTKLQRGISEQKFFGQDIAEQKVYQARNNNPAVLGGGGANKKKKRGK